MDYQFARKIFRVWYEKNKRILPWRESNDPYHIWVSEIILQQTRVSQGIEYYHKFVGKFPDLASLASAGIDEVMNCWKGLGYYSRARNMHECAGILVQDYGGKFPVSYRELQKLRGIGRYTAAAISSLAFRQPVQVVDGNVFRVITRLFGIEGLRGNKEADRAVWLEAGKMLDPGRPDLHNQAVIEFGALQCRPARPDCAGCPLWDLCTAYLSDRVPELPSRKKPAPPRKRYLNYFIIRANDRLLIRRREQDDIWKMLYEFPLVETGSFTETDLLFRMKEFRDIIGDAEYTLLDVSPVISHQLTHRKLVARFFILEQEDHTPRQSMLFRVVHKDELAGYAFPALITRYLGKVKTTR